MAFSDEPLQQFSRLYRMPVVQCIFDLILVFDPTLIKSTEGYYD